MSGELLVRGMLDGVAWPEQRKDGAVGTLCVVALNTAAFIQEVDMLTDYRGWTIDPTPDFFFGKYFARARIVQMFADDREEPAMHIERDIAWFDHKDDAIDRGVRWAIMWIDARSEGADTTPVFSVDGSMSQRTGLIADRSMSSRDAQVGGFNEKIGHAAAQT